MVDDKERRPEVVERAQRIAWIRFWRGVQEYRASLTPSERTRILALEKATNEYWCNDEPTDPNKVN